MIVFICDTETESDPVGTLNSYCKLYKYMDKDDIWRSNYLLLYCSETEHIWVYFIILLFLLFILENFN